MHLDNNFEKIRINWRTLDFKMLKIIKLSVKRNQTVCHFSLPEIIKPLYFNE